MNLKIDYQEKIAPLLMSELGVNNIMAVPRVRKVVLNIGLKEAVSNKGVLEKAIEQLAAISGQKPKVTRARVSIANFKVREGDPVGLTATLRGQRMYDFMTKLFTIVLPKVRDFHGVSLKAFDGRGNYTLGLAEQTLFAEIDYGKVDRVRGLEITFVIGSDPESAKRLLESMGMPFEKAAKVQSSKVAK